MSSFKLFLLLMLTGSLMMAGLVAFVPSADHDVHYELDHTSENLETRRGEGDGIGSDPLSGKRQNLKDYEDLSPAKQKAVDAAIDGEKQVFEDQRSVPAGIVQRDGKYYYFDMWRDFDWFNPSTFVPALVAIGGFVASAKILHVDITGRDTANRI